MIPITDSRIESYLMKLIPAEDPYLVAMEKKARESGFPIIDRLVGRFLYLLTRIKQPLLIVELGSGFGYSGYWFARALSVHGRVVLTDYSEENIYHAQRVYRETGLFDRAEFRVGDALRLGQEYEEIDLLFIDLEKEQYEEAIRVMLPRLARNALVVADNVLWHGKVAEEGVDERETAAIKRFNTFMFNHDKFFTTIIPLRDGVMLAYRLS